MQPAAAANRFIESPLAVSRAFETLAAAIRRQILSGELADGERLPSETALAQQANVSRSTVREALRLLQEAGFVERASAKVLIVRVPSDEPAHREMRRALRRRNATFGGLHEALVILEPALARLAAMRATSKDLTALDAILERQEGLADDFDGWSLSDQEFHLQIAEISGNEALIIARTSITELLMPALHDVLRSARQTEIGLLQHRQILDEIRAGDAEASALMAKRHIDGFRTAWEARGFDLDSSIDALR
jgi:DNA-binding FadR family transcriptional regulator